LKKSKTPGDMLVLKDFVGRKYLKESVFWSGPYHKGEV